jgi:UDPglucose--hexose-1-phosphate uridylyltransferase
MAGASLSHAHTQIMALPMVPPLVQEELNASNTFYSENGRCAFCDIIKKEENGPRQIYADEHFITIAPWASINPYEFWILPKRHMPRIIDMTENEKQAFSRVIRRCFGRLYKILYDPPYNFGIHTAPVKGGGYFHWHLEVYPHLSVFAGFEKSTHMFINTVEAEKAAEVLRC